MPIQVQHSLQHLQHYASIYFTLRAPNSAKLVRAQVKNLWAAGLFYCTDEIFFSLQRNGKNCKETYFYSINKLEKDQKSANAVIYH